MGRIPGGGGGGGAVDKVKANVNTSAKRVLIGELSWVLLVNIIRDEKYRDTFSFSHINADIGRDFQHCFVKQQQ